MYLTENNTDETDRKILTALCSISCNVMFNKYALDNINLGLIKPGDKVPYECYIDDLGMREYENYILRSALAGEIIDSNETIGLQPMETYYKRFFIEQVEAMFVKAPKKKKSSDDAGFPQYKYGLLEYLQTLYEIYKEIAAIPIQTDALDIYFDFADEHEFARKDELIKKFIVAIKTKGLRKGSRIDRYVKPITYRSGYLNRLIKECNGHYILINSDTESLDYKLALLSCFSFLRHQDKELFELKIETWEELYIKRNRPAHVPNFLVC